MGFPASTFLERAVRQDEAHAEILRRRAGQRRESLRLARLFHAVAAHHHYVYEGCPSLGAYAESIGFSAREGRLLAEVGKALAAEPRLEERILAGRISLDAAAVLGRFHENAEELARSGEDWLDYAERWTARRLERELRKRMREAETGGPVSVLEAVLTATGREKFERARALACRKERRVLDEGQTVEVLSDHYLDSFDPLRKEPRKRRMADTSGGNGNGSRAIPAEAKRAVLARQGDRCANPECDREIFLHFSHGVPHARGGSREAENLERLCYTCHRMRDAGLLRVERTESGLVFRARDGRILGEPRAPRAPP